MIDPPEKSPSEHSGGLSIAIIGMAGRFPGAPDVATLWRNLLAEHDAVTRFADGRREPLASGEGHFVPAGYILPDIEWFDAAFFAMSPREAEITDPQHRVLLEVGYEALENAGYAASSPDTDVGVYVGCGPNSYLLNNILAHRHRDSISQMQLLIANEKDYLATRLSYKLDLRGPSIVVQSACSTSLLAVHVAARALVGGECDLALAGGVSFDCPQGAGYWFEPGGILSPDGHCRPFGARAAGTVRGSGAAVVVLKRLEEAVADRDTIYAVIRGTATNNDGSGKVGYAAPSITGQARVIRAAHADAEVAAAAIGYVEAHGTATALGDPVEIAALAEAFDSGGEGARAPCRIGSIKSNIGHLDAAAGVAGMIKATLALHHEQMPSTLHYSDPNPAIDIGTAAFEIAGTATEWPRGDAPRLAGVSSFGIGGANVHLVLEEAPARESAVDGPAEPTILRLSAMGATAVRESAARLARHLQEHAQLDIRDAAFTLKTGRRAFPDRLAVVACDRQEAARILERPRAGEMLRGAAGAAPPHVALMFPGQGTQYPTMAAGLYGHAAVFTETIERCATILQPLGIALIDALGYRGAAENREAADERLAETWLTQPVLFSIEYALAQQWISWGVRPAAMIGHSIGEYVAACLAGVFGLEDALSIVCARGRLMHDLPPGSMIAVAIDESSVARWLDEEVCLAAANRPSLCVLSGPTMRLARLHADLVEAGIHCEPLRTAHAFHSQMVEPCLDRFADCMAKVPLHAPSIPFVSNLTGTWITADQAVSAAYWTAHLRGTVRFVDGLRTILEREGWALIECGPGRSLAAAARDLARERSDVFTVNTLAAQDSGVEDRLHAARMRALLWCNGLDVGPADESPGAGRIALPTYPFQRKRYWIDVAGTEEPPYQSPSEDAERAPDDAAESVPERLSRLWRGALGLDEIGIDDDFFALGGDSILGMQIAHRARGEGLSIAPRMILEHPTIARLATALGAAGAANGTEGEEAGAAAVTEAVEADLSAALIPTPEAAHAPFALTDLQHAYWIGRSDITGAGSVAAHVYEEYACETLDVGRLQAALRGVIARHPMLRAVIMADGRQRVLEHVPDYEIVRHDLRSLASAAGEARLAEIRDEKSHRIFPSDVWPLFDISVSLLPDGAARLHVSFDLLITDAWSITLFWRELERRYLDPDFDPPQLSITFRDYVLAEERLQSSAAFALARDYWLARLPGFPGPPNLPLARDFDSQRPQRFVRRTAGLNADAWNQLKATGKRYGLTASALLCTAYAEILAAWSETPRFSLNLPAFNRLPLHPQIGEVMGDFTSVLLFEVDTATEETFAERARRLQMRLWEDLAALPFNGVKLLRLLAEQRSSVPAMPYVFTSLIFPDDIDAPPGRHIGRLLEGISQTPQVWLDCQVWEEDGALLFNWDSLEARFDPTMIDKMFGEFQALLTLLAEDAESWDGCAWRDARAAGFVSLARQDANDTARAARQTLIHAPFLAQAAARPRARAIEGAARLSYAELERASAAIACDLRDAGVQSGARVAIVAGKGWEQIAAALAVARAGCAYVPIDPDLPCERRHALIGIASVTAAITVPALDRVLDWPVGLIRISVDADAPRRDVAWRDIEIDPDAIAYIIFTSGTTGVPKGVVITHRAASNTIEDINRRFDVTEADRTLALSALWFDLSVYDIFGLLAAGGTIVVPQAGVERDPEHWLDLVRRERVTLWNSVPALMELFVTAAELARVAFPSELRLVLLSGDWIPTNLPDRIRRIARGVTLIGLGGATEASIWSILHPIGDVNPDWRSIPYGRALANQRVHVLDAQLRARPDGVPGELYIGGVGLAVGYLDAGQTRDRFLDHPVTGERLYRTGDLGRWLPDGTIEFLGRADTQVKINGFRIEVGEIETEVRSHRTVGGCVVVAAGDGRRTRRLVCYVCPRPGTMIDPDELRAHLAQRLPAYMIPAQFVTIAALPLSANGKIDVTRLPDHDAVTKQRSLRAAHTPTEKRVAAIWHALFGIETIGVDDDFFALGGDSRLATELVLRIRAEWPTGIALRTVFQTPTIRALSELLDRPAMEAPRTSRGPVAKTEPGEPAPLTSAQIGLWLHDLLEPAGCTYMIVEPFRFCGPLDAPALLAALEVFVARHDILRTIFVEIAGEPRQVVSSSAAFDLDIVDLSDLPGDVAERRIDAAIEDAAQLSCDLATGPLFRARLLRVAADDHVLIVAVHHIVWDAGSTAIMIDEVSALYRQRVEGSVADLAAPALRFADVATWEQEQLRAGTYRKEIDYWRRQLASPLPTLALPADRSQPAGAAAKGARADLRVEPEVDQAFRALCRARGTTPFIGYLAVWQLLLRWWCGQDDVVVGIPHGYREDACLTGVVGFLVNSLAVRTRLGGNPSFLDYLADVHGVAIEAYAHHNVPFDRVVEELRPSRGTAESAPIFRAWFVLHDVPMPAWQLNGVSATTLDALFLAAVHDIKLSLAEQHGALAGGIDYRDALFEPETIAHLCRCFVALLQEIVKSPERTLSGLAEALAPMPPQASPPPVQAVKASWDFASFGRSPPAEEAHGI